MGERDISGERILITGANSGIGKATALKLAQKGAHVILVARSRSRGESALKEIIDKTGNESVEMMLADLSSQRSIRQLAEDFKSKFDRLDVLINNAGGIFGKRRLTEDGIEWTFAVNHLAYFLLTNLLLDVIKKSTTARIINVASEAHRVASLNLDDINKENGYGFFSAYGESKLANIMFTYELARRLKDSHVTVNCVHPGVVRTRFGSSASPVFRFLTRIASVCYLSAAKGAETSVYLATSDEVEGVTGKYFIRKEPVQSSSESYNRELARKLWNVSANLTMINDAG